MSDQENHTVSDWQYTTVDVILFSTVVPAISLWILVVNLLTVITIARSQDLQHKRYLYIKSLAVVDFLTGLTTLMRTLSFHAQGRKQTFVECALSLHLVVTFAYCSFGHLFAITVDRYIAITRPLRYDVLSSERLIKLNIAFIWCYSITTPALGFAWPPEDWIASPCSPLLAYHPHYVLYFLGLSYFLLNAVHIVLYIHIYYIAWHQNNKVVSLAADSVTSPSLKPLKVILLVYGTSLGSYLPCMVISMLSATDPSRALDPSFMSVAMMAAGLLFANSGMNFVIYVWRDEEFRRAMRDTLRSCTRCSDPQ